MGFWDIRKNPEIITNYWNNLNLFPLFIMMQQNNQIDEMTRWKLIRESVEMTYSNIKGAAGTSWKYCSFPVRDNNHQKK